MADKSVMRNFARVLLPLILVATCLVYYPGLGGDFLFDDLSNILDNERFQFKELTWQALQQVMASGDAGVLKRPLSMASFAINIAATGFDPYFFKLTNVFIHLLNGLLVFQLAKQILWRASPKESRKIELIDMAAMASAAIWLVHPLNLTSVLYVVQRMNSLAALFTLLSIVIFVGGRERIALGQRRGWVMMLPGAGLAGIMAMFSKENGVLIPVFLVIIEAIFFKLECANERDRRPLRVLFLFLFAAPIISLACILYVRPDLLLGSYQLRDFTPSERLLTEARVLWMYIRLFLLPNNTALSLYHDDFAISTSLIEPLDTIAAILGLIGLLAIAVGTIRRMPLVAFAIFWFLGGHLLESTFLPLEIAHEHRNYIPLIGPTIAISYYAICSSSDIKRVLQAALVIFFVVLCALTATRSYAWGDLKGHTIYEVSHKPNSERARIQMGRVYAMLYKAEQDPRYLEEGIKQLEMAARTPNQIGGLVGLIRLYYLSGKTPPSTIFADLVSRVGKGRQPPATPALLQNLSNCNLFQFCSVPDDQMMSIFGSFLTNPEAADSLKPIVSLVMAQYAVDRMGDGGMAIELLEAAVKMQPSYFHGYRNLARLYRLAGDLDRAQADIGIARKLDKYGEFEEELRREEAEIARAKTEKENKEKQ